MDYQEIIERLRHNKAQDNCHDCGLGYVTFAAADAIENLIAKMPVSAHWICKYNEEEGTTTVICSHCGSAREVTGCYESTEGESLFSEFSFCPDCGAAMDEKKEDRALSESQKKELGICSTNLMTDGSNSAQILHALTMILMCKDMAQNQFNALNKLEPGIFDDVIVDFFSIRYTTGKEDKDGVLREEGGTVLCPKTELRTKVLQDKSVLRYWRKTNLFSGFLDDSGDGTLYFQVGETGIIALDFSF